MYVEGPLTRLHFNNIWISRNAQIFEKTLNFVCLLCDVHLFVCSFRLSFVVWVIHSFALALDPFHVFSLSYSAFGMFCFLTALRLFVCPSAVGCHLVHSFICLFISAGLLIWCIFGDFCNKPIYNPKLNKLKWY